MNNNINNKINQNYDYNMNFPIHNNMNYKIPDYRDDYNEYQIQEQRKLLCI